MMTRAHGLLFAGLLCLTLLAFMLALLLAPVMDASLGWQQQLPRVVAGFSVGGMLALAGVLLQVLLRNPLAEPYVLGISGGATAAALAALMLGLGSVWVASSAFAGSLLSVAVLFLLVSPAGRRSSDRLLLTGVVLAAGWGALISFMLVLGPEPSLGQLLFWLMGDLAHPVPPWWSLPLLGLSLGAAWVMANSLDLLVHGDEQAAVLGVEVRRLRLLCYLVASLLTALAVTLAGPIGFIGLLVPQLMRYLVGARHALLIPASLLAGGSLLVLLDLFSRLLVTDGWLPVGVVTAVLGVPVFLFMLRQQGGAR
ncbi:MAG: iron ABC transporter permease [Halomonadaceae bacterium]|nr:MAG: iron ABC transporter permease [Halomonadaceae bacterium]